MALSSWRIQTPINLKHFLGRTRQEHGRFTTADSGGDNSYSGLPSNNAGGGDNKVDTPKPGLPVPPALLAQQARVQTAPGEPLLLLAHAPSSGETS